MLRKQRERVYTPCNTLPPAVRALQSNKGPTHREAGFYLFQHKGSLNASLPSGRSDGPLARGVALLASRKAMRSFALGILAIIAATACLAHAQGNNSSQCSATGPRVFCGAR